MFGTLLDMLVLCCANTCRSWSADHPAEFIHLYGVARSNQLYLLIYMALVLLFVCLLLTRDSVFSLWSIRASTQLHNRKLFNSCTEISSYLSAAVQTGNPTPAWLDHPPCLPLT